MTPKRFAQWLFFPNPSLICSDWFDWSHFNFIMPVMPDKAVFVSAVLLCGQRYRGNHYFTAPKVAPRGKEWISILVQTNAKIDWWWSFPSYCYCPWQTVCWKLLRPSFSWKVMDVDETSSSVGLQEMCVLDGPLLLINTTVYCARYFFDRHRSCNIEMIWIWKRIIR